MSLRDVVRAADRPNVLVEVMASAARDPPLRLERFPWSAITHRAGVYRPGRSAREERARALAILAQSDPRDAAALFIAVGLRGVPRPRDLRSAAHTAAALLQGGDPDAVVAAAKLTEQPVVRGASALLAALWPERFRAPSPLHCLSLRLQAERGQRLPSKRDYLFVAKHYLLFVLAAAQPSGELAQHLALPARQRELHLLWYVDTVAAGRYEVYGLDRWLGQLSAKQSARVGAELVWRDLAR